MNVHLLVVQQIFGPNFFREKQRKYAAYKAKSKAQKPPSAADFANCVRNPMFNAKDDELVIKRLPPDELHLHLGSVNKHVKEINRIWGNNRFYRSSLSTLPLLILTFLRRALLKKELIDFLDELGNFKQKFLILFL